MNTLELITLPNGRNICISSASPNSWEEGTTKFSLVGKCNQLDYVEGYDGDDDDDQDDDKSDDDENNDDENDDDLGQVVDEEVAPFWSADRAACKKKDFSDYSTSNLFRALMSYQRPDI